LLLWALGLLASISFPARGAETIDFLAQAKAAYEAAAQAKATNASSLSACIDLARTAFDYADRAPNDELRETIAHAGIAAGKAGIAIQADSVGAHYYLALNIGQLARTKMLSALGLLTDMEGELKTALRLDPKFDYAGANRTLGVLYLEAPGWPVSIGSKSNARANLTQALALAPEYPDNHLSLMEACVKWREPNMLTERIAVYEAMLPAAKTNFTGADWNDEWADWARRFEKIHGKAK
jgi:tetratricopeptide (TPR) repeat protein